MTQSTAAARRRSAARVAAPSFLYTSAHPDGCLRAKPCYRAKSTTPMLAPSTAPTMPTGHAPVRAQRTGMVTEACASSTLLLRA